MAATDTAGAGRCEYCGMVLDVGPEGHLAPNDDYETALVVIDELDKGTSKRQLARRAGIARPTVRRIDENREQYLSRR